MAHVQGSLSSSPPMNSLPMKTYGTCTTNTRHQSWRCLIPVKTCQIGMTTYCGLPSESSQVVLDDWALLELVQLRIMQERFAFAQSAHACMRIHLLLCRSWTGYAVCMPRVADDSFKTLAQRISTAALGATARSASAAAREYLQKLLPLPE